MINMKLLESHIQQSANFTINSYSVSGMPPFFLSPFSKLV